MVGDFFNYMFSKGDYAPKKNQIECNETNVSSSATVQNESIIEQTEKPKFSYINEMKTAQNKREENVNRFLTTPGFIETLNYYRPNEHPEIPGYASTIGDGYYGVLKDLNNVLLTKNQGEELTNLLMTHFEGRSDTPDSFFDMMDSFCFSPDSEDPYQYYGDKNSLKGLKATISRGTDAVNQLRKDLGSRVSSFDVQKNENGYVTEMSVTIDGCSYSVSYDYFEDSGYPLSQTKTQTVDGVTTTKLTCYSYGQDGELLEDSDINDDGVLDTIINYDDSYNVISYQNLDVTYLRSVDPDATEVLHSAIYGDFNYETGFREKISKTTDDKYILHTKNLQGEDIEIPMDSQGYVSCADFYGYMQTNKADSPLTQIINPAENTMYRYNNKMQLEKVYLDDNSLVVYDLDGNLIAGKDRSRNKNPEIIMDEKIGNFSQGSAAGDCWLLATLDSLSTTKAGKKLIKDAIAEPWFLDNGYKVKLGGREYSVTEDEILQAKNNSKYSQGDDDVLLFELGYEKYLVDVLQGELDNPHIDKELLGRKKHMLDGGTFGQVMYALGKENPQNLSKEYFDYYNESFGSMQYDYLMQELAKYPEDYAVTVTFLPEKGEELYGTDSSGNKVLLANALGHGWSIQKVENGFVTMSNPWDTETKNITMSASALKEVAEEISFCYIK